MIQPARLKDDLQKQVILLEKDLHARLKSDREFSAPLQARYDAAFAARRTAVTFIAWAEDQITQSAVAWVLATVFVRFLEDNGLLADPLLSGPGERRGLAQDALSHFFMEQAGASERDYLLHHFDRLRQYPAMAELLGPHNALHTLHPTPDALKGLIAFWREIDPASGDLRHDFTDPTLDTRFLGDLYQDLSATARKTYALLQTPHFIEEFILDRTLTPAIQEFGLKTVRMIDPTCGSGHFLLGAFHRLFALWEREVPTTREAAVNALNGVFGVDLNPFAIAITRFRLIIAACQACGVRSMKDAPDFEMNVAVGDSLLHGRRFRRAEAENVIQLNLSGSEDPAFRDELKHHYEVEDANSLHRILGQQYHAVVGNPPYITVKDRALSELYRARYPSCSGKYSLSVPFMERFFDLAVTEDKILCNPAGFVGQITANSFMKREFGKKLIEEFISSWNLTHVIDTSGVYIPGHSTPTIILFGRNQIPSNNIIRTILGIRGEPTAPENPEEGLVWQAILIQINIPGINGRWVSSVDSPRANFHKHPWSVAGGGAAELKIQIEKASKDGMIDFIDINRKKPNIGFASFTGIDEVFISNLDSLNRSRIESKFIKNLIKGDAVRDWIISVEEAALVPYNSDFSIVTLDISADWARYLWPKRTALQKVESFELTREEEGSPWWGWYRWIPGKYRKPVSIVYSEIATHNHFAIDFGGRVFNQTAPVIKLKDGISHLMHCGIIGILNSSVICYWLKQVSFCKGAGGAGGGLEAEEWCRSWAFNAMRVAEIPFPEYKCTKLSSDIVKISKDLCGESPESIVLNWIGCSELNALSLKLKIAKNQMIVHFRKLVALQEEMDWQIYEAFNLVEPSDKISLAEGNVLDLVQNIALELGQRAFEIVLARRMAAGEVQTTWFERHGSTPITELPDHWPAAYRELVERRIQRIAEDPNIRLIEQPEYKRRWNTESWDDQFQTAAKNWLLARLETYSFDSARMDGAEHTEALRQSWPAGQEARIFSLTQITAVAQTDAKLMELMEIYTGTPAFDLTRQIRTLLEEGSVPFLPSQRYKESGLRKRRAWEETWDLQRKEDAVEEEIRAQKAADGGRLSDVAEKELQKEIRQRQKEIVGEIPVPPKYASTDFKKAGWWKLRGKLDVPKERWISYPGLESGAAPSPLFAWAGWAHLQQAQALAALYVERKESDGWNAGQLTPLLAGLQELIPWLRQWHNEEDPEYGLRLGDYFAGFLEEECRALGLTAEGVGQVRLGA